MRRAPFWYIVLSMNFARNHLIWLLFCIITGAVLLVYVVASLAAGRGEILLPLDDVYIHFQYAKQLANGQPYIYNPGQPPTSGATSFLYPYILAIGYVIGFEGLNLGLWAMLIGALAFLGSLWLVYLLLRAFDGPDWLAIMMALIFGLTGAVQWHFMSAMETGLMILFTLATLYAVVTERLRLFVIVASLLALTRPEGGILAAIAVVMFFVRARQASALPKWQVYLTFMPLLMLGVQPLVNLLVTGSAVASGNSAKSIFGMVPFYWDMVLGRIWANFSRMWVEFVTGVSPREGLYVPFLIGPAALIALALSVIRRERWYIALMVIWWLLAGTAAFATLDTAFWHFKRYQMPLIALFYPLAGWVLILIIQRKGVAESVRAQHVVPLRIVLLIVALLGLLIALPTSAAFLHHFALNVNYVYLQPLQMAHWLKGNTPEDALIAVHDVGMMRYMGGRNTLDMVGLTTPGAAAYWRNGPGSVAEFLIQNRPDYIASYGKGHGFGLGMIAETGIYGDPLAEFSVTLDNNYNVALAAGYQGIYEPEWALLVSNNPFLRNMPLVEHSQTINVSNLVSEAMFDYKWDVAGDRTGFPTLAYDLPEGNCAALRNWVVDGARAIGAQESFTIQSLPGQKLLLMTMFNPVSRGVYDIYVNNKWLDRNWIPDSPGCWSIAYSVIPADLGAAGALDIRLETQTGTYAPSHHAVIPYDVDLVNTDAEILALYHDGALMLLSYTLLDVEPQNMLIEMIWNVQHDIVGDYRFFLHVYKDPNQPPIAQADEYLRHVPLGNLPEGGVAWTGVVDLDGVSPGTYQLAIGFYDPYTGERLMPASEMYEVSADGRLFLGEVEIPERSE